MDIDLKFLPTHILVTTPPVAEDSALESALLSSQMGMAVRQVADTGSHTQYEMPLVVWRHNLRAFQRYYDIRAKHYAKVANTEFDPVVFGIDGVSYPDVKSIPFSEDITRPVGSFTLTQPSLVAIDPTYDDVGGQGISMFALPGEWKAHVLLRDEFNGYGVARLVVTHASVEGGVFSRSLYEAQPAGVAGVDGGTCGFFDQAKYPTSEAQHHHEDGTFYKGCCDATECRADFHEIERLVPADILPSGDGVNSRTLIGDGSYGCFVHKQADGLVVAACLVFDYWDKAFYPDRQKDG